MKIETTVTITADNGTLYVHADGCDGHIAIPVTMERNEQNLQALAILALTPYARKIGAHQSWWSAAVADPGVREFVDHAIADTVLRATDREAWQEKHHG